MLRGRAGALALVPPVEPVGVAPLIDVEDALPLVRKALRSRVHLKAWHSRLCEPSEACRSEVHSFFSANGNALLPFNLGLKQITTRLPLLLKCAASEPVALVDVGAGIHGLAPWYKLHATSLTPDDSDALWLLGGFGRRAEVHAFESTNGNIGQASSLLARRGFQHSGRPFVHGSPPDLALQFHPEAPPTRLECAPASLPEGVPLVGVCSALSSNPPVRGVALLGGHEQYHTIASNRSAP